MRLIHFISSMVCLCGTAGLLTSCSSAMPGIPSMTLISDQNEKMPQYYTPLGEAIEEQDCLNFGPFNIIVGGTRPVQEALLAKMLEDNKADVLLDAEFRTKFVMIPLLFSRVCVTISGTPAKLK